jgi:hypothetical protein
MARLVCIYCIGLLYAPYLACQELEPRLYAALPKKMNALGFAYALSKGNVLTDPSLPVSGLKITVHNWSAAYVRTFAIAKRLARAQITLPFFYLDGKAMINGRDTSAARSGFGDVRLRFSVNLFGTPAYDRKEFTTYSQKTVVGLGIVTSVPTGLYYQDKRINIGSNRWAFKPEIGVSKRLKRFYGELFTGVWFYTDNADFYHGGRKLEQEPVFSLQGHVSYYFKNRIGISASGTWFEGGKTIVDGSVVGDLLGNWRAGASLSVPLAKGHSLKLQFHTGVVTSSGYDYHMALLGYQYVFF